MRTVALLVLVLGLAPLGASGVIPARAEQLPTYRVIVHSKNETASVSRDLLRDLFLKKTTAWPGGEIAHPADLLPKSPVRRAFTKDVLGRSVEDIKSYWLQRIFSGRDVPPPELEDDVAAVRYVTKHRGAIAYVSGATKIDGAKEVLVR